MANLAVLTSGGDSPGMNAAISTVARCAAQRGLGLIGLRRGFNGLTHWSDLNDDDYIFIGPETGLDIADSPGTFLKTGRSPALIAPGSQERAAERLKALDVIGLVVIGGEGSLAKACRLAAAGVPCVGIPGSIANDLAYTEATLGYDTAVNVCADVVNAIRATSRSHDRPHVVEVMGWQSGEIALMTAASTGSEIVLVPEVTWSVDEVAGRLSAHLARGNARATVVAAEGCRDSMEPFDVYGYLEPYGEHVYEGQPMTAELLARVLKYKCGAEVRATVVGYAQRGRRPTARDRAFAFEAGSMAVDLLVSGAECEAVGLKDGRVFHMPMIKALGAHREFNYALYDMINSL